MDIGESKIAVCAAILLLLMPQVFAVSFDEIRSAGEKYSKGEAIMVDGPFYVEGKPYYVVEYMFQRERRAALVYDPSTGDFVKDRETMRRVFATKDLKLLTLMDPLFYAIGNSSKIPLAAKYETQNVRNFASFSSITPEERVLLERFLSAYERVMEDVKEVTELTNQMLYPGDAYHFEFSRREPNIVIEVYNTSAEGNYSYEGFQRLIEAYERLYEDYLAMAVALNHFAGGLEDYPPGATIREKWGVIITREDIIEEIRLIKKNADHIQAEIELRRGILEYDYADLISKAYERLGVGEKEAPRKAVCGPTFISLLPLLALALRKSNARRTALVLLILLTLISGYAGAFEVPSAEELISQKISLEEVKNVSIKIEARGITEAEAREILAGYPLLLRGESVVVKGPFYEGGVPNYLFEIYRGDAPTGYAFMVNWETKLLVSSQRDAYRLQKAHFLADLVRRHPLYAQANAEAIESAAHNATLPPLEIFLMNLSENIKLGKKLEEELIREPSFDKVVNLTQVYLQGFILIHNIEALTSPEEALNLTSGFSANKLYLEAYARAMRGLSADEYFEARRAMYRGRTLNRIPLMYKLSALGLRPSKAQVVHDLTSDLIYDNIFLWRLGKKVDPRLFARLAYKEGTASLPSVLEEERG
jgi:hypothetical protein